MGVLNFFLINGDILLEGTSKEKDSGKWLGVFRAFLLHKIHRGNGNFSLSSRAKGCTKVRCVKKSDPSRLCQCDLDFYSS